MADWSQLLQTFGLAVAILVAIGLAIWKTAGWLAKEMLIPFRDLVTSKLVVFFDKVDSTFNRVEQNIQQMTKHMEEQTTALQRIENKTDHALVLWEGLKEMSLELQRIENKTDHALTLITQRNSNSITESKPEHGAKV